ncbi:MAG: nickel pincer cofactor biosynthesis protein LarC [Candidatus Fibromonas sp.]|nr:nickel pincer cofactor biosynthesis protein LarC [Candidatus Fibromonas sp.]
MRTLYLECNMGAAGDMLMAALLELHDDPKDFLNRLNGAGIPGVTITSEPAAKCGITGTHINVDIARLNGHHHVGSHAPADIINHLKIPDTVKKNALEIYRIIADAESHVHGVPVSQIHFHELGEMDAIADITGVCMLMEELAPELVLASPINVGSGQVNCAHGILPVPAPATAHILQNVPIYNDEIKSELCTPTGAALLKYFAREFCKMPVISVAKLGYGLGKKDFEKANCVRAYLGNTDSTGEEVVELICNLDDMTPEAIAFAQQLLSQEGALDVYTTPIGMKKGRPGLMFTCMCNAKIKDKMLSLIFKHTTTLGIREHNCRRYALQKEHTEIQTEFGAVRVKTSRGFGVVKSKPEYEDIAGIAREKGKSIRDVLKAIPPL